MRTRGWRARRVSRIEVAGRGWVFFCAFLAAVLAAPAVTSRVRAQESSKLGEMLHRLFATSEFEGKSFGPARWLEDGTAYTTVELSSMADARDIVRYDTATGKHEVLVAASQILPPGEKNPLAIEDYAWSKGMKRLLIFTNSRRVWRQNTRGDYWVLDRDSGKMRKLGGDAPESTLMFAKFSPDGNMAAYVRANNIYVEDLATGAITQLTHDGSETIINGTSDWVNEEELDIRDGYRWSPDSRSIAYWQFNTTGVRDFMLLYNTGGPNDIVTNIPYPEYGVYPTVRHIPYPQPGTTNSAVRVGVVGAAGGATRWMDVPGDPRNYYIPFLEWAGNSDGLVMQHLNRLQNQNAVLLADARTGAVKEVTRDEDKAWVDVVTDFRWLQAGKEFLWVSERDGWRHVYTVSRDGKNVHLATPGTFDVISVEAVDKNDEWLYYIASPDNATERYLYRTRLDGTGAPQRLTPAAAQGTHSYEIAPDCQWAFHTYSTFDSPPAIDLVRLPDHKVQRVLEANGALRAKIKPLVAPPVEFFKIEIGDGVTLDGWMIRPRSFDRMKKYPLLIEVYGEPAAQTVVDRWGGTGMLFHRAIADEGYLVASFDNRGTPAPKGRAWRKIIYGSVGVLSSKEQAAALEALERTRSYVDSKRVAVWGWSGGGTNTLNLMFRSPQLYQVGMAVAPVPDQRLYDTIYQERYMGLPQDNVEGYKAASAINFAEGLRGNLLLVHGSGDDNVHYQGSELLINRMIELGKQFDFMEYPGRTHAIVEGKGTRLHLFSLLARYLEEHLPAGPVSP